MAWNRADTSSPSAARKASGKSPSLVKGAVAGIVVVAVLGLAAFFIFGGKDAKPKVEKVVEKKPAQLAEVKPAAAAHNSDTNEGTQVKSTTYRDEHGILRYKNGGARAYDPTRISKTPTKLNVDQYGNPIKQLFHYRSENEIARFLTIEPGDAMFGSRRYDARFEEEFRRSCQEPIIVNEDDTPEEAELKRQMTNVKIEIAERMRNGEKLADILEETRTEYRRLAEFKRNLRQEILNVVRSGESTDADVSDVIKAANSMLAQKGIAPIKGTGILKAGIKYRLTQARKKGAVK